MTTFEPFTADGVRGFLHRAAGHAETGLVLTHGAGGNCAMPLLVTVATALCAAGCDVLRCDLPFRQRRPKGPPSPSGAAADREGLRLAVEAMRALGPRRIILGGQSYGGRQATMLAADHPGLAAALLLFSYPLHPPGRPDRLRIEHLPRLKTPSVFVSGTVDPFGSPAGLRDAISLIPVLTEVITVEAAGHDLRRGRFDLAPVLAAVERLMQSARD
jgi:predicted alpha/beta-hydrolase family hydrolase